MKRWSLLLVVALLALVFLASRERFVATATIKNPNGWDAAEYTRIKAMVSPASTATDAELKRVVGGFWGAWDAATSRITLADVNTYLDGVAGLGTKRNEYRDLIQAYYINQGQSVFTSASGYSAGDMDTASPPAAAESSATTTTTVERPTTSTSKLRQDIAATMGIPTTNTAAIDAVISKVQSFYDTVYLPDKTTPTYTDITGFADGVDVSTVPAAIQNNFKVHLISILQTYFAGSGSGSGGVSAMETGATGGGADVTSPETAAEGGQTFGTGKNVQGPASGGQGTANTTGGLGIPRTYPLLYGGLQDYKSALPTSASLGTDPTSKFLPYSRVPGDQDMYPDPYRLGKYFSSSSYSDKEAPEPAPFLADFSKFLS